MNTECLVFSVNYKFDVEWVAQSEKHASVLCVLPTCVDLSLVTAKRVLSIEQTHTARCFLRGNKFDVEWLAQSDEELSVVAGKVVPSVEQTVSDPCLLQVTHLEVSAEHSLTSMRVC